MFCSQFQIQSSQINNNRDCRKPRRSILVYHVNPKSSENQVIVVFFRFPQNKFYFGLTLDSQFYFPFWLHRNFIKIQKITSKVSNMNKNLSGRKKKRRKQFFLFHVFVF